MRCSKCKEDFPIDKFARTGRNIELRSGWQAYCKPCMLQVGNAWRSKNKERANLKARQRSTNLISRLKTLLNASTVDRTQLDLSWCLGRLKELDYRCEITRIPFTYVSRSPTGLSIDRIDPNKAYTKDNVRFVCWWVNAAMGNWGLETLQKLIETWKINAN